MTMNHDLIIRASGKFGPKGEKYDVLLAGEIIASGASPEFAACRVLDGMGLDGLARFWREGKPSWGLQIPIKKGAKRTVVETTKIGPRFGKWAPNPLFQKSGDEDA